MSLLLGNTKIPGVRVSKEIIGGVELPELTNPAVESAVLEGYEYIDSDGKKKTGAMPTATQATPSITINSSGLITATATQTAGYVAAGTKAAAKPLTTQGTTTIMPTTRSQTAVASGCYTIGNVTVAGDANLVASNIKKGTSIFGVTGTYSGSTGTTVNTCTVKIITNGMIGHAGTCNILENGIVKGAWIDNVCEHTSVNTPPASETCTIKNVVCNSAISLCDVDMGLNVDSPTCSGTATFVGVYMGMGTVLLFTAPSVAGEVATIDLRM